MDLSCETLAVKCFFPMLCMLEFQYDVALFQSCILDIYVIPWSSYGSSVQSESIQAGMCREFPQCEPEAW